MNVQLSLEETYGDVRPVREAGARAAFLSIQRGCSNLCSFCIVPFVRGRERSRSIDSIVDEVKAGIPIRRKTHAAATNSASGVD